MAVLEANELAFDSKIHYGTTNLYGTDCNFVTRNKNNFSGICKCIKRNLDLSTKKEQL